MIDQERLALAYDTARRDLLAQRLPEGHWSGRLSSSALSTATAASALALAARHGASVYDLARMGELTTAGLAWLAEAQNADGGWGDTDKSRSNIATTMLVRAAFHLAGDPADRAESLARAGAYIEAQGGLAGLKRRYGRDKTFAVPILTNCALAGLVPWSEVAPLPFELACLPQSWFRFLRLPVVSYAIPALVAIGQARFVHGPPANPILRRVRTAALDKSLRVLEQMQPASGGFLEATPLTSFVAMSLASIGQAAHPVTRLGIDFLVKSARPDGSWPIDTNLATWVTTLAINALAINALAAGRDEAAAQALGECRAWLLSCQHRQVHPFTGAAAGGWGWSDLSGAVPDADDTAGALVALAEADDSSVEPAAVLGIDWLLDLENRDGGWPTFCRGWGKLPFDRSGTDLTAHALRALERWRDRLPDDPPGAVLRRARIDKAVRRGFRFLARQQQADGSWLPLWFGNQDHPHEANPVYGTARVLLAYAELDRGGTEPARRGLKWLADNENPDGGWGGDQPDAAGRRRSSVEETALAVEALAAAAGPGCETWLQAAIDEGLGWLVEAVEAGRHRETSPIGFYFAKLWYYEALYPLIHTVSALGRALVRPLIEPDREPASSGHPARFRKPAPGAWQPAHRVYD
ncbi:MAG: prenyltransferase/squalene oxidase repeat-containing protein [Pirellulales bacterium]